jgi:hypothetical protein
MSNIQTQQNGIYRGRGLMLQQTSKCCHHGEGKREGVDSVEVVKKVSAWTRWHWRCCSIEAGMKEEEEWVAHGRGRGVEMKTLVGGVGGGGFSVHRCGADGWADGVVPGRGMEPMTVEAVGEALVWTCWRWRQ